MKINKDNVIIELVIDGITITMQHNKKAEQLDNAGKDDFDGDILYKEFSDEVYIDVTTKIDKFTVSASSLTKQVLKSISEKGWHADDNVLYTTNNREEISELLDFYNELDFDNIRGDGEGMSSTLDRSAPMDYSTLLVQQSKPTRKSQPADEGHTHVKEDEEEIVQEKSPESKPSEGQPIKNVGMSTEYYIFDKRCETLIDSNDSFQELNVTAKGGTIVVAASLIPSITKIVETKGWHIDGDVIYTPTNTLLTILDNLCVIYSNEIIPLPDEARDLLED